MNKKGLIAILAATFWITVSEFVRNEILLKDIWTDHYSNLGVEFSSAPINGAIWVLWSLLLALLIYYISKNNSLFKTIVLAWIAGFLMMWLVIGNLSVLPINILIFAVPLSILEVFIAALIINKIR